MAGIAKLWKPVINVTDLDEGERFWSAVSGLSPQGRHGQFSVLDTDESAEGDGWVLLHLVPEQSGAGGTHVDFRVDDVARAVTEIEAVGGVLVRSPGMYAPDGADLLEWAVMKDPFDNSSASSDGHSIDPSVLTRCGTVQVAAARSRWRGQGHPARADFIRSGVAPGGPDGVQRR